MPRVARAPCCHYPPLATPFPALLVAGQGGYLAFQSHPQKRPFWWMKSIIVLAIHQNGLFGGRTANFVLPSTKMPNLVDDYPLVCAVPGRDAGKTGTTAAQRPGAAATARPGCGELNPKGSPPRPAVAGTSPRAFEGAFICA